ncbi:MAG: rRNA cytosine-C5-methylase, partial [Alphaproteobacteria bacterium]|nr:rRNA cytosine-C5-methylase [Alphaproteobacteria bacterium]
MTPAARIAASIDLLADILRGAAPADALARDWFARRRYAGGGDRRAIRARVWDTLRR